MSLIMYIHIPMWFNVLQLEGDGYELAWIGECKRDDLEGKVQIGR